MHNDELLLNDIPINSLVRIERGNSSLLVIRSAEQVFVYEDKCPHASWPLSQGTLNNFILECPGHGWEFDALTGRCLNAPAYCLTPVNVRVCGDIVHLQWQDSEQREENVEK